MDIKQRVLNTTEAMQYLRTSRATVLKMVHEGKLKGNKIGREYRFLQEELDKYLRGETDEPKVISGAGR
jgi:excisionase family DNA binding protein